MAVPAMVPVLAVSAWTTAGDGQATETVSGAALLVAWAVLSLSAAMVTIVLVRATIVAVSVTASSVLTVERSLETVSLLPPLVASTLASLLAALVTGVAALLPVKGTGETVETMETVSVGGISFASTLESLLASLEMIASAVKIPSFCPVSLVLVVMLEARSALVARWAALSLSTLVSVASMVLTRATMAAAGARVETQLLMLRMAVVEE